MARIVQTGETPAKRRNAHMRSCAEVLRLLAQRPELASGRFDAEAKDMVAFLSINLRGIGETIEGSAQTWDDRGYWKKAEDLRERFRWSSRAAIELESAALGDRWHEVTPILLSLIPHFGDITIQQLTRDADWWCGALRALKLQAEKRALEAP